MFYFSLANSLKDNTRNKKEKQLVNGEEKDASRISGKANSSIKREYGSPFKTEKTFGIALLKGKKKASSDDIFGKYDFFETKDGLLHCTGCGCLEKIVIADLIPYEKVDTDKPFCYACYRRLIICSGAYDYREKLCTYERIYQSISTDDLEKFYIKTGIKTALNKSELFVHAGTERWKIELTGKGAKLFHNNYVKDEGAARYMKDGYHEHKKDNQTLWTAMQAIMNYTYDEENYDLHQHEHAEYND